MEELPDHSLRPINLPNAEQMVSEFWNTINNPTKASVNILTDKNVVIHEQDGCKFISITVPRAQRYDKPVYIDNNPLTGTYRRNGEGDYKCTQEAVQAMMLSVWKKQGWAEPVLTEELSPERITLALPLQSAEKSAIKNGGKITAHHKDLILQYLTEHVSATTTELAEVLDLKASRVRDLLAQLQEEGYVVALGSNRNRTYKLKT